MTVIGPAVGSLRLIQYWADGLFSSYGDRYVDVVTGTAINKTVHKIPGGLRPPDDKFGIYGFNLPDPGGNSVLYSSLPESASLALPADSPGGFSIASTGGRIPVRLHWTHSVYNISAGTYSNAAQTLDINLFDEWIYVGSTYSADPNLSIGLVDAWIEWPVV